MRSNKSYVKETLAFVNKLRKKAGADPLNDIRGGSQSGERCPISRSLADAYKQPYTCAVEDDDYPAFIYVGSVEMLHDRRKIRQTRAVRRFVRAFDAGRLPEYHI